MMNRKVWGHRGCRGAGSPPENSLAAFGSAIDVGVGGIELDIHLSQDAVAVVMHDASLARMTGVQGNVSSLALADLKKLHLVNTDGRPSEETIPTLDEVLDLVERCRQAGPFVVNIEIKDPESVKIVAAVVRRRLAAGWRPENFLISSFDMACLRHMRTLAPNLPIGTLFECAPEDLAGKIAETKDLQPASINIPYSSLTRAAYSLIRSKGILPVVWVPAERKGQASQLVKRLREEEFILITDFPNEVLRQSKPNVARATATGVLAACLCYGQQNMLFQPTEFGLEKLKSPSQYPELTRFGFSESQLKAQDGVQITVWECKGLRNRPHFVLFHGNRAHWGDTGPCGGKFRDRRARLRFIEELASGGAGVTAITLRGFGGSSAEPSEHGFLLDLQAVAEYIGAHHFDHSRLVIAGESMGTWAATQTAVYLTRRGAPPALLSLQNPFTRMADVGEQVVSHLPLVRSLKLAISASAIDRHVLKSHFYTANLIRQLRSDTAIHIGTSGNDDLVPPAHSDKLVEIARENGLRVIHDIFAGALHHNIPPIDYARRLFVLGVQSCQSGIESLRLTSCLDPVQYLW